VLVWARSNMLIFVVRVTKVQSIVIGTFRSWYEYEIGYKYVCRMFYHSGKWLSSKGCIVVLKAPLPFPSLERGKIIPATQA